MSAGYGKAFEIKFREDFSKIDDVSIDRLYDQTTGYKTVSRNVADYICYKKPHLFYLELKVVEKGNTLSFQRIRQYDLMLGKLGIPGVNVGVLTWFVEHKKVCYTPIEEIKRLKELNCKSINIKMLGEDGFNTFEIPSTPKRVFLDTDYTKLFEIAESKEKVDE